MNIQIFKTDMIMHEVSVLTVCTSEGH